jgi:Flp pilus assembly protein TadB
MSATVIAVAPLGFAALASITDPDTARFLFASPGGALCLATGVTLDLLGWRWMGRIAGSVGERR